MLESWEAALNFRRPGAGNVQDIEIANVVMQNVSEAGQQSGLTLAMRRPIIRGNTASVRNAPVVCC